MTGKLVHDLRLRTVGLSLWAVTAFAILLLCHGVASAPAAAHSPRAGVRSTCPTLNGAVRVTAEANTVAASIPRGAVAMIVCRYAATAGPRLGAGRLLRAGEQRTRSTVTRAADYARSLKPKANGPVSCPYDNGSAMVVTFTYSNRPRVRVLVRSQGCRFVVAGGKVRFGLNANGSALLRILSRTSG